MITLKMDVEEFRMHTQALHCLRQTTITLSTPNVTLGADILIVLTKLTFLFVQIWVFQ